MVLALLAACGPGEGSPFTVSVTPEIRATFRSLCVDPRTGKSDVPDSDLPDYVGSSSVTCDASHFIDPAKGKIIGLRAVVNEDPATIRQRIERIVFPVVNEYMRDLINKHVFADLGVNKEIRIARRGKGVLRFKYEARPLQNVDRTLIFTTIEVGPYCAIAG